MDIFCSIIAAIAAVLCAVIAARSNQAEKSRQANDARVEARAKQRAKEGRLQLQMINANSELTVGLAMAMKNGRCNGEVEDGLKAVQEANDAYKQFLENLALNQINGQD